MVLKQEVIFLKEGLQRLRFWVRIPLGAGFNSLVYHLSIRLAVYGIDYVTIFIPSSFTLRTH